MNFTPKIYLAVLGAILAPGVAIGWQTSHTSQPSRSPVVAQDAFVAVIPAVQLGTATGIYQPVKSWYKRKSWWKKNAPVIGGAGGGALVGGLVGGGTGAVIGRYCRPPDDYQGTRTGAVRFHPRTQGRLAEGGRRSPRRRR